MYLHSVTSHNTQATYCTVRYFTSSLLFSIWLRVIDKNSPSAWLFPGCLTRSCPKSCADRQVCPYTYTNCTSYLHSEMRENLCCLPLHTYPSLSMFCKDGKSKFINRSGATKYLSLSLSLKLCLQRNLWTLITVQPNSISCLAGAYGTGEAITLKCGAWWFIKQWGQFQINCLGWKFWRKHPIITLQHLDPILPTVTLAYHYILSKKWAP